MSRVLMGFGPFRFSLATFGYEKLQRKASARLTSVKVIGRRPSIHNMGLDDETLSISAEFHPRHLPGNRGLDQLAALYEALGKSFIMIGNRAGSGEVLGQWVLKGVSDTQTRIFIDGIGQVVSVDIDIMRDEVHGSPSGPQRSLRFG